MQDAIIFLGTAGDAISTGKQVRASGGIIIQLEGNQFHLDPGPGALVRMQQYDVNPREHTAVFVSYADRLNGIGANEVISAMTYDGMDQYGLLVAPEEVVGTAVTDFYGSCVEKYINWHEDSRIAINEIEITGTPTRHKGVAGAGFVFTGPDSTISYTSDTDYLKMVAEAHDGVDVLIANCTYTGEENETGFLNEDDVIDLLDIAQPELCILTRFGMKAIKRDPLTIARRVQKQTGVETLAARDGMTVDPSTFASNVRQRKLKNFK
jgi:ribonuclease BN (tRNA processing enzyme)